MKKEDHMMANFEKQFFMQKKSNVFALSLIALFSLLCAFALCATGKNILTTTIWNNTLLILPLLIIASLLFSQLISAANDNVLAIAIWQNKIAEVQLLLKKGADPRKIKCFYALPSIEISNLLLQNGEKSLSPEKFLSLILRAPSERYNAEKQVLEPCINLANHKDNLIKMVEEKDTAVKV
jgi:hypothetical protein